MELSQILGQYVPVLDHGFVSLKGVFGGDEDVEEFARVSYQKGTRKTSDTRGLLRYLIAHHHGSPLEAVEFKFHLRMPIFVARQWARHRTANTNEASARYSIVRDLFYVPTTDQIQAQSTTNKQGREDGLDIVTQGLAQDWIVSHSTEAFQRYALLLEQGVARETARMVLPQNTYTEMYWKTDLRNLLHFLGLRCDSHAQWEIRQFANVIANMVQAACPLVYEAWLDYQYEAVPFSRMEMNMIRSILYKGDFNTISCNGADFDERDALDQGMTKREWNEFVAKIDNPRNSIPELDLSRIRTPEQQETIDKDL